MISFLIIFKIYNEKYIKIFLYHCYSLCQYSNFKIVFQSIYTEITLVIKLL